MSKAHLIMGMVLCFAVLSGCNKKACERYCSCDEMGPLDNYYTGYSDIDLEGAVPGTSNCEDECEKALDEEDLECRGAFRRMARCLDQLDCEADECWDPIDEVDTRCSF